MNERFELIDLREKPKPGEPTSPWYNAGVYAFRPSIFAYTARLQLSARGEYELTDAIRDLALSGKKVQALEIAGAWADVRDPEILAQLKFVAHASGLRCRERQRDSKSPQYCSSPKPARSSFPQPCSPSLH